MKTLALIPARSGSKGVPNKNVQRIRNVPLIAFSIWTAQRAGLFDEVLLSTDDPGYFDSVKCLNLSTEYIRPPELSQDTSPTIDAILDALDWYEKKGKTFDAVMLLQPPAPFRTVEHLCNAVSLLEDHPEATCVTGIVRVWDQHPARVKRLEGQRLVDFCEHAVEIEPSRRQDLQPPAYLRNGSIYLSRVQLLRTQRKVWGDHVLGMEMPEANSVNVDRHLDFITASSMLDYEPYRPYLSEFDELIELYNE
ncbi:N-acylneuraminate cytidylyltransferase/CMP-N,N'-diacetyllegionaminic acid synthase [Alkalispirochaeta americana]|uniref:N-acylneuraminate cytidylyltransferase/CMP-N,N'-diacetyllegionaminic acid synthase n=1 Tax=Alkalispirochaeta americana TaxID=159291 RepID=A0A1N6XS96_9SPIO|nr:acylneuraminate cytidylyltransferase family protein [Alkalispirochaeta americana]SIR05245.1 N-acylneuraminate cytidylyltransferase/CMP-N,N'-diacetyllegionaminic acid synthase [Alkalispirochaeta americana]